MRRNAEQIYCIPGAYHSLHCVLHALAKLAWPPDSSPLHTPTAAGEKRATHQGTNIQRAIRHPEPWLASDLLSFETGSSVLIINIVLF